MAKMPSAAKNGPLSRPPASERQRSTNRANVTSGTGHSHRGCSPPNQRLRICGWMNGVYTLTMATKAATPIASCRALRRAHACTSPSVFSTSQHAPSRP